MNLTEVCEHGYRALEAIESTVALTLTFPESSGPNICVHLVLICTWVVAKAMGIFLTWTDIQ